MTASHTQMANAIRALSMDAVQNAKSGHPGMPMGMADVATALFTRHLKFNPSDSSWADRDRFVLSAGHGSMLLYSLFYLLGYEEFSLEEIRNFRQWGARTAGHPEYEPGGPIETTTGPLGQGIANAVGMAMAERHMAACFGDDVVDHHTYVIAGDGCLMEGISHEAISLAGHLKLSKLIVLFDDNGISIDGPLDLTESGDQIARFEAAGWRAERVDGHNQDAVSDAIERAKKADKPSLIACKTIIGFGAPSKAGTSATHGAPLGDEEIAGVRKALNWPAAPFEIPDDILGAWRDAGMRHTDTQKAWQSRFDQLAKDQQSEFLRRMSGELPADFGKAMDAYRRQLADEQPTLATRKASELTLGVINKAVPETIGGSADLTGSNNTLTPDLGIMSAENFAGRFVHYGVREHGMAAAMNGLALHGGIIPYSGTFLVFTDYCRPAIRMAALMGQRVIQVMTHDSIGLGEDGPTHQPVEHLASLRAMPNVLVFRPADAMETAECWQAALEASDAPSVLALTRQGLPALRTTFTSDNLCSRGAYEILASDGEAQVTLLATGSEVSLAAEARTLLHDKGIGTRVVSMPCWELFDKQTDAYRAQVLGDTKVRIAVEAGVTQGWDKYVQGRGAIIGIDHFGASAPYKEIYKHFGITSQAVADAAQKGL